MKPRAVASPRSKALLDVNVVIALLDPAHVHHDRAHDWFAGFRGSDGVAWATCPLVENGVIRIVSHPAYAGRRGPTRDVSATLGKFTAAPDHEFWPDSVSILDEDRFDLSKLTGHGQITDVYLLALAVRQEGSLATFDRTLPMGAVRGAGPESVIQLV